MEKNKNFIEIDNLKKIIDEIFSHIKNDLQLEKIELTEDYYWAISESSLYSIERDMEEPVIGSLFEDWEFLGSLLSNKNQAVSLMLAHVAPLMRYMAIKIGQ